MRRTVMRLVVLGLVSISGLLSAAPAGAITFSASDFESIPLAEGLNIPVDVAWAPDGRMFVAELYGRVRVVSGGRVLPEPLIDISDHVNRHGDRGFLGIATDADFARNHYLYLLYTYEPGDNPTTDAARTSRLTRVVVRPDNTVSNPESPETVILGKEDTPPCPPPSNDLDCIPSDGPVHSIGSVRSDTDGTLWLGSGDASTYSVNDDRALRAYDERTFPGKIVHIDREGRGLPGHPYCPGDDDLTHVCTKIYASGFRNPYRFQLRGGGLGPIVGDVGFNDREEIDLVEPGRNYGWPCWEGEIKTPAGREFDPDCKPYFEPNVVTPPYLEYDRTVGGTVIAGPVYPGGEYPDSFDGSIFVGDYVSSWLRRLVAGPNGPELLPFAEGLTPLDLELGPQGNLVYVHIDWATVKGTVNEIAYCPLNCAPVARAAATPAFGDVPLTVSFDAADSTDSDGDALTFDWDFGDGSPHSSETAPEHEYATAGVYTARLTATDPGGRTGTASVQVAVGNSPPTPSIDAPADESLYAGGEPVQLKGSATDAEDGVLDPEDLRWRVVLHHRDHVHPYDTLEGPTPEFTPSTDHDTDSYFEVVLTARDSGSLEASRSIELRPRSVPVTLDSSPPGAPVSYSGQAGVAPFTTMAATGYAGSVSAATTFKRAGRTYRFVRWSDGGAAAHGVSISAEPMTLVATYDDATPDVTGPTIGFNAVEAGPRARRGVVAGSAKDRSGVASVAVAVRARSKAGCRWWLRGYARLMFRPQSCKKPQWMRASIRPGNGHVLWRTSLGGPVPRRHLEVLLRAVDRRGNSTLKVGRRAIRVDARGGASADRAR